MVMLASVISVDRGSLLVRDLSNGQEVRVNTRNAGSFNPGDRIAIFYNGVMTRSLPPQINAISIQTIQGGATTPQSKEFRAQILDTGENWLFVRDMNNNSQIVVRSPYARFFCRNQQIIVKYDNMRMSNPPEVNAVDILPACR